MLNYLKGFCQLKILLPSLFLLLVSSCTRLPKARIPVVQGHPVWFAGAEKYSFRGRNGDPPLHVFFDFVPFSNRDDISLNFFMHTPAGSEHAYQIDLLSGRPYKKHRYCKQDDVWQGKLSSDRPPFSIGIVPRLLDQLGGAQKIIVYGQAEYYRGKEGSERDVSHRVRVVGAVVEKFCRKYPCRRDGEWESKLVLVAVDPMDSKFSTTKTFAGLKKLVHWEEAKVFLENANGRSFQGDISRPASKISGHIEALDALKFAMNKGHLFKFNELQVMRYSCEKLYDYIWQGSKKIRQEKKLPEGERSRQNFSNFFKKLNKTYAGRLKTCAKFVRPSNIQLERERHWFFAYLFGFLKMQELGYVFLCDKLGWVENPYNELKKGHLVDYKSAYNNCTDSDLDIAFATIPATMRGLMSKKQAHYRYMTYDFGVGGSHEKIYHWVYNDGKDLLCEGTSRRQKYSQQTISRMEKKGPSDDASEIAFPQDVSWRPFSAGEESLFMD